MIAYCTRAALPHPYMPSDVVDTLFDDPGGIIGTK